MIKNYHHWKKSPFYKQYGMTMAEMGRRVGVSRECVRRRLANGKKVDGPNNKSKAKTFEGKTIREWAKELNVSIGAMTYRIRDRNDPHYLPKKIVKKEKPKSKPKQLDLFSWYEKEQKILERYRLGQIKMREYNEEKMLKKERKDPRVILSGPYKVQWKAKKQIRMEGFSRLTHMGTVL